MLDLSYLARKYPRADIQLFQETIAGNTWTQWIKPRGKTMANILAIGAGSGGGGGFTGIAATSRGGGGSGASGGMVSLTIPLLFLPDTLFIQIGVGGNGGAAGSNGVSGSRTFISLSQDSSSGFLILASSNANATAGQGATSGTGGNGGNGATIFPATGSILQGYGIFSSIAGAAGQVGGTDSIGGSSQWGSLGVTLCGGGGGGGASAINGEFAGGDVNGLSGGWPVPTILGGIAGGGVGGAGISYGLVGLGGSGGGSHATVGTGGVGGNGGLGSGGGGGGGGLTGGAGGKGGPGLAMIVCY